MENNTWFTVFNITMPANQYAFLATIIVVCIVLYLVNQAKEIDPFLNNIFLFLVIWKLSYVITNWVDFINNPLSVLYFNGGSLGTVVAFIVVLVTEFVKNHANSTYNYISKNYFLFFLIYAFFNFFNFLFNQVSWILALTSSLFYLLFAISIVLTFKQKQYIIQIISMLLLGVAILFSCIEPLGLFQLKHLLLVLFVLYLNIGSWFAQMRGRNIEN